MTDPERAARNQAVIDAFHEHGGIDVAPMFGLPNTPLLLLTTVGARTGQRRTTALGYLPDGDRFVVYAANGGRPKRPDWYHNLFADPNATIEIGTGTGIQTVAVRAEVVPEGPERDDLWARQCAVVPMMAAFQDSAGGVIPVIALVRT